MRYLACVAIFFIVSFPAFVSANTGVEFSTKIENVEMAQRFIDLTPYFLQRFHNNCDPLYEKSALLGNNEQVAFLIKEDQRLNGNLGKDEWVQCLTKKGAFIDRNGVIGSVTSGRVRKAVISRDDNLQVVIKYISSSVEVRGQDNRSVTFSYDATNPAKNKVTGLNILDFALNSFRNKYPGYPDGLLTVGQQVKILNQVYQYAIANQKHYNLFMFFDELLTHPKKSSKEILALYDRSQSAKITGE